MIRHRTPKRRAFVTTLEFDQLPALGRGSRHAGRGRVWQRLIIALGGFWLVALAVATAAWIV